MLCLFREFHSMICNQISQEILSWVRPCVSLLILALICRCPSLIYMRGYLELNQELWKILACCLHYDSGYKRNTTWGPEAVCAKQTRKILTEFEGMALSSALNSSRNGKGTKYRGNNPSFPFFLPPFPFLLRFLQRHSCCYILLKLTFKKHLLFWAKIHFFLKWAAVN